jgi:cyclopropane-fatty-acyl-phospholipid synthase
MTIALPTLRTNLIERSAQSLALKAASSIQRGSLQLTLPDGSCHKFGREDDGPAARLHVHTPEFFARALRGGEIGFGEAYMDGLWDSDDLTALLTLGILNRGSAPWILKKVNEVSRIGSRHLHLSRQNSRSGSRKNIAAHYDLNNEFFASFLDESMTYSSAVFASPDQSLPDAQANKYEQLCRKAEIKPNESVLEIGCGWGGFALHAAQRHACRVDAITISKEQAALARQRVAQANCADRVCIDLRDYRDVAGSYDCIVAIEMFEAVGAEYFCAFFEKCDALLKPGGRLVLQTISVPERTFADLRDGVNWMQKYIFPGGMLPSLAEIEKAISETSFIITDVEDIAPHYVETLRRWRLSFEANLDTVRSLGFDDRFIRMWRYYLSAAEAGFETRSTGDLQVVLEKPVVS